MANKKADKVLLIIGALTLLYLLTDHYNKGEVKKLKAAVMPANSTTKK